MRRRWAERAGGEGGRERDKGAKERPCVVIRITCPSVERERDTESEKVRRREEGRKGEREGESTRAREREKESERARMCGSSNCLSS